MQLNKLYEKLLKLKEDVLDIKERLYKLEKALLNHIENDGHDAKIKVKKYEPLDEDDIGGWIKPSSPDFPPPTDPYPTVVMYGCSPVYPPKTWTTPTTWTNTSDTIKLQEWGCVHGCCEQESDDEE